LRHVPHLLHLALLARPVHPRKLVKAVVEPVAYVCPRQAPVLAVEQVEVDVVHRPTVGQERRREEVDAWFGRREVDGREGPSREGRVESTEVIRELSSLVGCRRRSVEHGGRWLGERRRFDFPLGGRSDGLCDLLRLGSSREGWERLGHSSLSLLLWCRPSGRCVLCCLRDVGSRI
jgi:hypothetical protein